MAKKKDPINWQNRIIEHGEMPANQYLAHELNARRHPGKQREALIGSLNEVGWVAPVIVSARTGKLLDGHARIEEALTKNEEAMVPFVKVDVSEGEERLILASFDPITNLAYYDKEILSGLLQDVQTGDQFLQQLLSDLAFQNGLIEIQDPRDFWEDMPEFENEAKCVRSIMVHFRTTGAVDDFCKLIGQGVTDKTKSIYHPAEIRSKSKEVYISDAAKKD